jgi:hypothetical protein
MDNTYNRHESIGAYGHGRSAWYAPSRADSRLEVMVSGQEESFTQKGCEMTLRTKTLPEAQIAQNRMDSFKYTFHLKDIDPSSIKVTAYSHLGGLPCETKPGEEPDIMAVNCDHADMTFSTRSGGGLIDEEFKTVYPDLPGADHEHQDFYKSSRAYFHFDDPDYAKRFAKAFAHAIELCGGRPLPF